MADAGKGRRPNQRMRTRKDILEAAARLMKQGRTPSLEEIAEEALVSRATAYRYFPGLEALLLEASLDIATPEPDELFRGAETTDPVARLERLEAAMHRMIVENEGALRMMLVHSLQRGLSEDVETVRQNRRTPLIEAAIEPARGELKRADLDKLTSALALVIGTEARIVFKDVLQIDDAEAEQVKRWAIRALVEAARKR